MRSLLFSFALACLLLAPVAMAQDQEPEAADLSSDFTSALSLDEATPAQELDLTSLAPPQDATPEELFQWVDTLPEKLPQPKSQEDVEQLLDLLTSSLNAVSDQVLAYPEVTTEDKIHAYQLKFQVMAQTASNDPSVVEKITALADQILATEKEDELQLMGIELKTQTFLARLQSDPSANDALLVFLDSIITSADTSQKVRESAQEQKAVALLIAASMDETKTAAFEEYFETLLAGSLSPEARMNLYKLRIQSLMPENNNAPISEENIEKLNTLVERLFSEDSEELKALGYAAKATALFATAQTDPSAIDPLLEFATKTIETTDNPKTREQMTGLMIQAYMLKIQNGDPAERDFLAFIDKMLGGENSEEFAQSLITVKLRLLSRFVQKEIAFVPDLESALNEYADNPALANFLPSAWASLYAAQVMNLSDHGGSIEDLQAILDQIKAKLPQMPLLAVMLSEMQNPIEKIGKNNGDEALLDKVYGDFAQFCASQDGELFKGAEKIFSDVLRMRQLVGTQITFEGIEVAPEENKTFNSDELKGKFYVVNPWNSSDQAAFNLMEDLKTFYTDYKDKGVEVVGINLFDDPAMLKRFLEVFEMPWILLSAKAMTDQGMALPDMISALPSGNLLLVDAEGKVLLITDDLALVRSTLDEQLGGAAAE